MIACRLSAFPWEGLNSLHNPNKQTRIKSLQCFCPINSMPSLVLFLTPPQAVWVFANILVGFRKGGIQLFSCSRSSEVSLISQEFLKEVGPEQALWREQGKEHREVEEKTKSCTKVQIWKGLVKATVLRS